MRFKEFKSPWIRSSIEQISKVYDGTHQTPNYKKNGVKFVSVENINDLYSSKKFISVNDYERNFKVKPTINNILMTRIGDIGTPALISENEPLAYYVSLALLKINKINPSFLYHYIQTQYFQKELWKRTLHVAFPKKINKNEIGECKVFYPNLIDEQAKIAIFLGCLEKRIVVQNKIIEYYESLIKGIRERVVNGSWQWKKLDELIQEGIVRLNRGNIIPKHQKDNTYKYPVYSSSTQNNGLMGYNDTYMFDKELITWSIDGGGNFFYRKKHKFNVTNVCGIMQVDENVYSYRFIAEMLKYQHLKMKFDYQSKAHPSVISSLYLLPCLPISEQNYYCQLFIDLDRKMQIEQYYLYKLKEQKTYLLSKMFI